MLPIATSLRHVKTASRLLSNEAIFSRRRKVTRFRNWKKVRRNSRFVKLILKKAVITDNVLVSGESNSWGPGLKTIPEKNFWIFEKVFIFDVDSFDAGLFGNFDEV